MYRYSFSFALSEVTLTQVGPQEVTIRSYSNTGWLVGVTNYQKLLKHGLSCRVLLTIRSYSNTGCLVGCY